MPAAAALHSTALAIAFQMSFGCGSRGRACESPPALSCSIADRREPQRCASVTIAEHTAPRPSCSLLTGLSRFTPSSGRSHCRLLAHQFRARILISYRICGGGAECRCHNRQCIQTKQTTSLSRQRCCRPLSQCRRRQGSVPSLAAAAVSVIWSPVPNGQKWWSGWVLVERMDGLTPHYSNSNSADQSV